MSTFFKNTSKSIVKSQDEAKDFFIEGVMSSPIVDFENEVIGTEAYTNAIATVKERVAKDQALPIFIEHRRKELSLPVGKLVDAWEENKQLYFRAQIAPGSIGEPIRELIKGGYLYGCSIGGDAVKTVNYFDQKLNRDVKKITKMELRELSLTGLPVNSEAVFAIAKSLNKDQGEVKTLMSKLDKAIEAQTQITSLEKAIDAGNLDEASLKRIKDSLNNLATLLGVDVSAEGAVAQPPVTQGATEIAPQNEDLSQKQPARQMVDSNAMNDQTNSMDLSEDIADEEMDMGGNSQLDLINQKLDKLLGEESGEGSDEMDFEDDDEFGEEDDGEESGEEEEPEMDDNVEKEKPAFGGKKKPNFGGEKKKPLKPMKKINSENPEIGKSINVRGGENMEVLKCRGCDMEFESPLEKSYDAKFCTSCGDRLEKSQKEVDISCEDCGSIFEKSEDYELHYCPKCGKSMADKPAMAVAPEAKGAKTAYKKGEKEMAVGTEDAGKAAMAVAPEAQGAKTKVLGSEAKDTGNAVEEFGADYVDGVGNKGVGANGERTEKKDEDLNDARPSGKPLLGAFDANKVKTYGTTKVGKSMDSDERISALEKTIESLTSEKSVGKQSIVPETVETKKIEKSSTASQADLDRAFVSYLIPKK